MASCQHSGRSEVAPLSSLANRLRLGLLALLPASMALPACLQINADFQQTPRLVDDNATLLRINSTQEPAFDTHSTPVDVVSTRPGDPSPSQPSQVLSSSTSSDTSSVTSSDTGLAAVDSAGDSSSSPTSSATTSFSGSSTTPAPRELWIPLVIQNPSATHPLLNQSSVNLSFDHAALVAKGASPDGSNLRVVTRNQGAWTQLHRVLDPQSRWNHTVTRIWFSLNQEIPANQSATNEFYLVVHPQTGGVLQDPSQVFLLFDDFSRPVLDTSRWTANPGFAGAGTSSASQSKGELSVLATATTSERRSHRVFSTQTWQLPAIAVDASLRAKAHNGGKDCTQELLTAFWSRHDIPIMNAGWLQMQRGMHFANHADLGNLETQTITGAFGGSTQHRYSTRWIAKNIEMWRDDIHLDTKSTQRSVAEGPDYEPLHIGFEAIGVGESCTDVQSELFVDWVMVRKLSLAKPQLSLDYARQSTSRP